MEELKEIVSKLHEINFGKEGIIRPDDGGENYDFGTWAKNGNSHRYGKNNPSACSLCDNEVCGKNLLKSDSKNARFTYVAHGTHTLDFIEAHRRVKSGTAEPIDIKGWSTKPVMFVLENPSNSSGNRYYTTGNNEQERFPSTDWFWLDSSYNEDAQDFKYPKYFSMKEYGKLFFSIIQTFHIANGYVTDSVKCGIGETGNHDKVTSTADYNDKIIENCVKNQLTREFDTLRGDNEEVVIFAFGDNAYWNVYNYLKDRSKYKLILLPHPVCRLSNEYRKYVLLSKIAKALFETGFYDGDKVDKIDFLEILKNSENDSQRQFGEILTKESLEKYVEEVATEFNINCRESSSYSDDELTWCTPHVKREDGKVKRFILRYRATKDESNADDYQCFWASYNLSEDIDLWRGKTKSSANEQVDIGEYGSCKLYQIMVKVIEKINRDL